MTELEKWQLVNAANTTDELEKAIIEISNDGVIQGRKQPWDAKEQAGYIKDLVFGNKYSFNVLTRSYGIRQQALYLQHYEKS